MIVFKKILGLAATGVALAALSGPALADLNLTDLNFDCADENPTPYNEGTLVNECMASEGYSTPPLPLTLQYKDDGSETGSFAAYYTTSFDDNSGTIVWDGGMAFSCTAENPCALIVKDGNQDPGHYIFDLTGIWNGTDTINLSSFWDGTQGAISHVAIWGGTSREVPEPATLALFGLGLAGLGLGARRRRKI